MRTLIVYYSRTGSTKKAVQQLAPLMHADIAEIGCARYRLGALNYLQAAYDSLRGKLPTIESASINPLAYDLLVVASPIWTGHPALPIRAFLAQGMKLPDRVALLVTRGGVPPERAFAEMQATLPSPAAARLALKTRDIQGGRIADALRGFAAELMGKPAIA